MHILFHQYDLIRQRRETLLEYCESLSPEHFTADLENFGGRSISYLLVHTANTYNFWLGDFTNLVKKVPVKAENYNSVESVRRLYDDVNKTAEKFLTVFNPSPEQPITNKMPNGDMEITITPLQLFTHVITHEYHHKGQILSMSRHLGYTPIDTDVIRFD